MAIGRPLLDWLEELGFCVWTESGPRGIDYQEISAWSAITQQRLTPWESVMIHRLSLAYASSAILARDPACPAPWPQRLTQDQSVARAAALRSAFSMMAGKRDGKTP